MKVSQPHFRAWFNALMLLTLVLLQINLQAQETTSLVKGIVQNTDNEPLSGVSVVIKNTKTNFTAGASTDTSGLFTFSHLPSGGPYSFNFSAVGYETQSLAGYKIKEGILLSLV